MRPDDLLSVEIDDHPRWRQNPGRNPYLHLGKLLFIAYEVRHRGWSFSVYHDGDRVFRYNKYAATVEEAKAAAEASEGYVKFVLSLKGGDVA